MKLHLLAAGAVLIAASSCTAGNSGSNIKVTYSDGLEHPDTLFVEHSLISNLISAKSADDLKMEYDTVIWKNGAFEIPVTDKGAASYSFRISDVPSSESYFTLYTEPGEKLSVNFTSLSPVIYTAEGSELLKGMADIQKQIAPVTKAYGELMESGNSDIEKIQKLVGQFTDIHSKYIKEHPGSTASVYALLQLVGDEGFGELYEKLTPEAKKSVLFPFAEIQYKSFKEAEKAQAQLKRFTEGVTPAPDFSLVNLDGKKVSLSEFKGKWIVLDFWGSWCGWCIKGFPALKEAYTKYHPKGLEVIGIDCNDTEQEWRDAVKKYELPWVQLYNGENKSLLEQYGITGFPTKMIVNPQGIVVNVTVGEDPAFFTTLEDFLSK